MERRYYTPAEVAEILNVSTSTVLRLIHDGRLGALRVSERIYRIPAPAFERYRSGATAPKFRVGTRRVKRLPRIGEGEPIPERRRVHASR